MAKPSIVDAHPEAASRSGHYLHLVHTLHVLQHTDAAVEARDILATTFRQLAAARGVPELFNLTLTYCWTHLIDVAFATGGRSETLNTLLLRCPELLDKDLPLNFYSRHALYSEAAKDGFVAPDIAPLPDHVPCRSMGLDGVDREH